MNKDIYFGKNSLRFLYYRYRDSAHFTLSVIVFIVVVCILLIFGYVIPQAEQWFSIRSEVEATLGRTAVIEDNIAYTNSLNRPQLDRNVQTATAALPVEKNFGDILNAIGTASLRSGVSFQDYAFQVGSIASSSGTINKGDLTGLSTVTLTLVIEGTVDQLRGFLREVKNMLPLSQVTTIDGSSGAITVSLEFYTKSLPKVTLKDDQPIPRVLETQASQLDIISTMKSSQGNAPVGPAISGSDGLPLF